jgi:hypothetical protein
MPYFYDGDFADTGTTNVIRVQLPLRLLWVCEAGHDHRFRLTAWLCGRLQWFRGLLAGIWEDMG